MSTGLPPARTATRVKVEPISAATLPGLLALFHASHSTCFCRYWHFTGNKNEWLERGAFRPEENAAELEAAVRKDRPDGRGLVAIDGDQVVGWLKLTPRSAVPKLRSLPVYRSLDLGPEDTTYAIGCVLVHPEWRRRGVARALIAAAPAAANAWGARAVEGYPRRSSHPLSDEEAWQGPEKAFLEADFQVVHDVPPYPVVRKSTQSG